MNATENESKREWQNGKGWKKRNVTKQCELNERLLMCVYLLYISKSIHILHTYTRVQLFFSFVFSKIYYTGYMYEHWAATCNCSQPTNWSDCTHHRHTHTQTKKNYFVYIMNYVHNMEFGLHCLAVYLVCLFACLFSMLLLLLCVHTVGVYCFASFKW